MVQILMAQQEEEVLTTKYTKFTKILDITFLSFVLSVISVVLLSFAVGNAHPTFWIPAFAGMTTT